MDYSSESSEAVGNLEERLEANLVRFRKILGESPDIIIREFVIHMGTDLPAAILCLENLVDKSRIYEEIIHPLTVDLGQTGAGHSQPNQLMSQIKNRLASVSHMESTWTFAGVIEAIFSGDTVVLIDRLPEAMIFNTRAWAERRVGAPETEVTVRGPRECFVETFGTNLALLRRKISHPDLTVESYKVGRNTQTKVGIVYLKSVVNEKIVAELRRRLNRIQTDAILGAGYIEQFIGDAPFSPFSTIAYSERPDVVGGKILEGRVAIIIDGTPEVLTVPALLVESFQSPDDYNSNFFYATLIRWIRYIAFGISLLGPAVYTALSSYNQELIPTPLFITMASGAEGRPYPVFMEVIIIGVIFEIFREAGIRLPRPIGQAIPFVAALIVAQASVTIGLVAVSTVVVVALTAIASLVVPNQANVSILIRVILTILASIFGAYGILLGLLWVLAHTVSLRSFGVPCLAPVAPFNPRDFQQDVIFRTPLWSMLARPRTIGWHNPRRQAKGGMPAPPSGDGQDQRATEAAEDKPMK